MPVHVMNYRGKHPEAIDTTSRSTTWSRGLSPFYLGPCKLYSGLWAKNVENAWQYSKVYLEHADQELNPAPAYFEWAIEGWAKERADRYPMGKGRKPLYSWWDGQKFDYVTARRKIYIPLYYKAAKESDAFRQLKSIYDERGEVWLRDFDGYDYESMGRSLSDVVLDPNRKMGHAFVLALMLTDPADWHLHPSD